MEKQDDNANKNEAAPARAARARAGAAGGAPRGFKRVSYVLNNVMSKLGLDRRLREHTLMNLWPQLAGEPWASRSRPIFIDSESKLVVAVSDASTGQELSLLKGEILRKVKAAGRSIGVEVTGLRFDLKHYHNRPDPVEQARIDAPSYPEPTGEDLAAVTLSENDLEELSQLMAELSANATNASPVANERLLAVFERELRLRYWMRVSGFPLCTSCDNPTRAQLGSARLCPTCYWGGK